MTKIIELAHALGEEIAASDELRALGIAKDAFERDIELQNRLSEYETERKLLAEEFEGADGAENKAVEDLKARIEALGGEIVANPHYTDFMNAQKAMNDLMAKVNEEIHYCISGERPSACTHDCSTCGGCSHS